MSESISEKNPCNPRNPWQVLTALYPDANGVTVASLGISICVLFLSQCPCALASTVAEVARAGSLEGHCEARGYIVPRE